VPANNGEDTKRRESLSDPMKLDELIRRQMERISRGGLPQDDAADETEEPAPEETAPAATRAQAEPDAEPMPPVTSEPEPEPEPEVREPEEALVEEDADEAPATVAAASERRRRRTTGRISLAKIARQQSIRAAVARTRAEQAQLDLPIDLPRRRKRSRVEEETREDLLERLLDPELSLAEAAKVLEVCPATVRRYADRGLLPHHRTPGNQRRFKLMDVLALLERRARARGLNEIE